MTELRLCIFSRNFAEELLVSSHCIPPAGSVSIYLITGAVYIGPLVKVMSAKLPQHRSRFGEICHRISVAHPSSTFPFIHRLTYIYLNSWTPVLVGHRPRLLSLDGWLVSEAEPHPAGVFLPLEHFSIIL